MASAEPGFTPYLHTCMYEHRLPRFVRYKVPKGHVHAISAERRYDDSVPRMRNVVCAVGGCTVGLGVAHHWNQSRKTPRIPNDAL